MTSSSPPPDSVPSDSAPPNSTAADSNPTDRSGRQRLVVVAGSTATGRIEGLSAAGADADALAHTPSADLEIVAYGRPVRSPVVPVSPTGCPTPAVVTRAVRERLGFDVLAIDAGLGKPTAAPTAALGGEAGGDVRTAEPVPAARAIYDEARDLATSLPDDRLLVGETIPGGTTTALGVLQALGERPTVSSSLSSNPIERKREVVTEGLAASDLSPGGAASDPIEAVQRMGDPVLAGVAGLIEGAAESDTPVTLAGGTQQLAAAALARHAGVEAPIEVATTSFVRDDDSADVAALADDLGCTLCVTDPEFDAADHPAFAAYAAGEAKEGVGMGGALALAEDAGVPMDGVRSRVATLTDDLLAARGEASV